jgi:hypothetical protein
MCMQCGSHRPLYKVSSFTDHHARKTKARHPQNAMQIVLALSVHLALSLATLSAYRYSKAGACTPGPVKHEFTNAHAVAVVTAPACTLVVGHMHACMLHRCLHSSLGPLEVLPNVCLPPVLSYPWQAIVMALGHMLFSFAFENCVPAQWLMDEGAREDQVQLRLERGQV